jgi:predicted SAM-dependent methyltransferase
MIDKIVLDLGCGKKKRINTIGVDFSARHDPDVLHDLNEFPYPFQSASIDYIYLDNVLEHLESPIRVMEEVYRILKIGGGVKVITPYFRSVWAFADPTHKHYFTSMSFAFYDSSHYICQRYDYTSARFRTEKIVFNEELASRFYVKPLLWFANRWPSKYEHHLSHIFPLSDITYYLRKE